MSRLLLVLMIAAAVVVLPQALLADDAQPPTRARPEMLFKRLDANGDGQVAAEEIPERAPESLKAMLKRADGNEDGKITAEEFAASVKQPHHGSAARPRRPAPTTAGSRRPGPPHRTSASGPRRPGPPRGPTAGPPRGEMPSRTQSRMGRGAWAQGIGGARPRLPDPKAMFERLDRDKDGKLSLGEFTLGMRRLHPPGRPPFAGPARPPMLGRGPVRAAAVRGATEARKRAPAAQRAPAARKAAPSAKRPPTDRTPEAGKQAAAAKKAAAKRAAEARKKRADAGKRAADAEKRRAREAGTRSKNG